MSKEENKSDNSTQGGNPHQTVSIHIDKNEYKSPTPTTGSDLYKLGNVEVSKYDLFREVHGKGDDEFIPNDGTVVELKNGDHFNTVQKNLNPGSI